MPVIIEVFRPPLIDALKQNFLALHLDRPTDPGGHTGGTATAGEERDAATAASDGVAPRQHATRRGGYH